MVDVTTTVLIERPLAMVAEYASDPDNALSWYKNIKSVEWQTSKPLTLGTTLLFRASFLGRKLEYTYEVVDYEPNIRLTMQTADGPFPMQTTYLWETHLKGTTMTLRNTGKPKGFSKFLAPMMERAMRQANEKDLNALKSILESQPTI